MIQDPIVVVAATPRGWAGRLRAHAADHGGVVIRATVLTPEDAIAEQCDVVVVDDVTSFLTVEFVRRLQHLGRGVLGIYDADDTQGKSELVDVGVDALAEADSDEEALVQHVQRLARRQPQDRVLPPPRTPISATAGRSRMIGVAGPGGGVGITELALEIAATLASADVPTVLVDGDELQPSLAQRLGIALHPNLHTALRGLEQDTGVQACLQPLATRQPLYVLPGMAAGEDWYTVRAGALAGLADGLRHHHRAVVVDLGRCLPPADGPTGRRLGNARGLAEQCDDVVVATAATPTAISRCINLVSQLLPLDCPLHLVLNRIGVDRYVRDEAVAELRRATGAPRVHMISEDQRVARAGWQGSRVGNGRFRRQVSSFVGELGWLTG